MATAAREFVRRGNLLNRQNESGESLIVSSNQPQRLGRSVTPELSESRQLSEC